MFSLSPPHLSALNEETQSYPVPHPFPSLLHQKYVFVQVGKRKYRVIFKILEVGEGRIKCRKTLYFIQGQKTAQMHMVQKRRCEKLTDRVHILIFRDTLGNTSTPDLPRSFTSPVLDIAHVTTIKLSISGKWYMLDHQCREHFVKRTQVVTALLLLVQPVQLLFLQPYYLWLLF